MADLSKLMQADGDALQTGPNLRSMQSRWSQGRDTEHLSTLGDDLLAIVSLVGDHSNIVLDPDLDTYYSGQVSVSSAPSVVMAMGGLQRALAYAAQKRAGKAVPERTSGEVRYWTTKVAGAVQDMQGYAMRASVANESLRPALMPANWLEQSRKFEDLSTRSSEEHETEA